MCLKDLLRWGDEGPVALLEPEESEAIDIYQPKKPEEKKSIEEARFDDESGKGH
jgi:hypothetical protein